VWVQASGQVQLLDWPLARKARVEEPNGDSGHDARALDLLARVAVLALEGQPRPAGAAPTTIRRPLPRHARRLLNRLLGVSEPYSKLADLSADLAACRDLPAEVTRPMRAAHLGVLSLLLAFGVLSMLQQGRSYTLLHRVFQVKLLGQHIGRGEAALRLLRSRPNLADDPKQLGRQLQSQVDQDRDELNRQYHELGWLARLFALDPSPDVEGWVSHFLAPERQKEEFDLAVGRATRNGEVDEARPVTVRTLLASLGGWPLLWVVWAFVTRGGLTLRMMGLNLVRADGRKASRWQCAWRAAIVWAPVVVLLALAVCAEVLLPRQAWMHTLLWSGAVLLLAGDFLLAWYYPRRSWHDRLVGTYLVPR
jgi:hypothetical protein